MTSAEAVHFWLIVGMYVAPAVLYFGIGFGLLAYAAPDNAPKGWTPEGVILCCTLWPIMLVGCGVLAFANKILPSKSKEPPDAPR